MRILLLIVLTSCTVGMTGLAEENGTIDVFFCDQVDCARVFEERMPDAEVCAMYNVNQRFLGMIQDAKLVVDGERSVPGAMHEFGEGYMHNKFCIEDDDVWTGSWNPSQEMSIPNNVVLINSKTVAKTYRKEFDELYRGTFHGGTSHPGKVVLNGKLVEVYFCPEDRCKKQVLRTLKQAQTSIHFMTFAFTDDDIGDFLADSAVEVKGIFDTRQNPQHSEYEKLKEISILKSVHHKVFIVDGKTVITGSYNPSKNGDTKNDENLLIIHDESVAQQFEAEFERLFD